MIEVEQFFVKVEVFQGGGVVFVDGEGVLVVGYWYVLFGGQGGYVVFGGLVGFFVIFFNGFLVVFGCFFGYVVFWVVFDFWLVLVQVRE